MKLSKKKIALAVAVAMAIVLPFMLLGGDTRTGNASTIPNYGWGYGQVPSAPPSWFCQYLPWTC